jgi:hypothetical protein
VDSAGNMPQLRARTEKRRDFLRKIRCKTSNTIYFYSGILIFDYANILIFLAFNDNIFLSTSGHTHV